MPLLKATSNCKKPDGGSKVDKLSSEVARAQYLGYSIVLKVVANLVFHHNFYEDLNGFENLLDLFQLYFFAEYISFTI